MNKRGKDTTTKTGFLYRNDGGEGQKEQKNVKGTPRLANEIIFSYAKQEVGGVGKPIKRGGRGVTRPSFVGEDCGGHGGKLTKMLITGPRKTGEEKKQTVKPKKPYDKNTLKGWGR